MNRWKFICVSVTGARERERGKHMTATLTVGFPLTLVKEQNIAVGCPLAPTPLSSLSHGAFKQLLFYFF